MSAASREWRVHDLGPEAESLRTVAVGETGLMIGRTAEGLRCPDDAQMSSNHARLFLEDGRVHVEEVGSTTGVWMRIRGGDGHLLAEEDQIWLGAQILLVRRLESGWELRHHGPDGRLKAKHRVPAAGVFIGRSSELVLDKEDSRLSRRHAQVVPEGEGLRLYDRGAHNGTYLKLQAAAALEDGDEFRLATHRFRLEGQSLPVAAAAMPAERPATPAAAPAAPEPTSPRAAPAGAPTPPRRGLAARLKGLSRHAPGDLPSEEKIPLELPDPAPDIASEDEATVVALGESTEPTAIVEPEASEPVEVEGDFVAPEEAGTVVNAAWLGETLRTSKADFAEETGPRFEIVLEQGEGEEAITIPARRGQTVLEAVQAAGLARGEPVDWECGDGGCGVCVMGLVGSSEGFEPPDPSQQEMKTIQITEQVAPDPDQYRLACLARIRGDIRL